MEKVVLNEARIAINGAIVGHSAIEIAEKLVLKYLKEQKCFWQKFQMQQWNTHLPWKKLSPVLILIKSDGVEDGFKK